MSDTGIKSPIQPDLDQIREDRCVPIARAMLAEMVTKLLPEDANLVVDYNPIVLKMLELGLEADLNITTEVPYIPQLILGAFSGLNLVVQGMTTVPMDEVRYAQIGSKILGFLAAANVRMDKTTPDTIAEDFAEAKEQIQSLIDEEKLTLMELKYIMDNVFDSFKLVVNLYTGSVEKSMEQAEAKALGVESLTDLTMKRLDEVLKKDVEPT